MGSAPVLSHHPVSVLAHFTKFYAQGKSVCISQITTTNLVFLVLFYFRYIIRPVIRRPSGNFGKFIWCACKVVLIFVHVKIRCFSICKMRGLTKEAYFRNSDHKPCISCARYFRPTIRRPSANLGKFICGVCTVVGECKMRGLTKEAYTRYSEENDWV